MERENFIPVAKRKKIMLLSDDMRMPSGIGTVSKEIVINTLHRYNWVQVGGAIKHPDEGKAIDMSQELKKMTGLDNYMRIYPVNGYGNSELLRALIKKENPDAILHFTDPRFWLWLYQIEHEIRQQLPIFFYHVWDDLPFPHYNKPYYESCDWIGCISKQTYNIVRNVNEKMEDWQVSYIPHGIDSKIFKPITINDPGQIIETKDNVLKNEYEQMLEFRGQLLSDQDFDFVVLYNNRNIRRKSPGDVILAFKQFRDQLTKEQQEKTCLIMHTEVVDNNGTDLMAVAKAVAKECTIIFSPQKFDTRHMNYLYNISDVTINMASNEGFGLSTAESIMACTPVVSNVTGGLQDQLGFVDNKGVYLKCDKHYNSKWGSNHDGKYKTHGEWALPVFPTNRSLVGSPPTPYIFDDRCSWKDAGQRLLEFYQMGKEERNRRGVKGREYMLNDEIGMSAKMMGDNFIQCMDTAMDKWEPKEKYQVYNV